MRRTIRELARRLPVDRLRSRRQVSGFKRTLIVSQVGEKLSVQIELASDATARRLGVRRGVADWTPLGRFELLHDRGTTRVFEARMSLGDDATIESIDGVLAQDLRSTSDLEPRPMHFFFEVETSDTATELVALGRFDRTEFRGLEKYTSDSNEYLIYSTGRGNLALVASIMPTTYVQVQIEKARIENGEIRFGGTLSTRHTEASNFYLSLEGRNTQVVIATPLTVTEDLGHPETHWGHRSYRVSATVPLDRFLGEDVSDDVFTVWVLCSVRGHEEVHRARAGDSRYLVRRKANEGWTERDGQAALVSLYYTYVASNLSMNVERFDPAVLKEMQRRMEHPAPRSGRVAGQKPVWLIGEQNYKAQDTGLAFFRFMRETHPEIDAYYVIAEDAPDLANLADLDHVVYFRSMEHIDLFFRAERLIGSHHPDYIYPSKSKALKDSVKTVQVFLQHGVMGMRRLDKLYGRNASEFHTDLFIVSSEREKRIAISDLGYRDSEVAVTGLARFDTLFDGKTPLKPRQILIMPTWREWLQDEHAFRNSEYLQRWGGLLESARFLQILEQNSAEAVLVLHPNMRLFADHFENPRVRLVRQGQESVQNLLKESGILITDYSSVGFDFSFLEKPVLFYHFDSQRFFADGAHIDLNLELPGPIAWSENTLLDALDSSLRNNSVITPEYSRRVDASVKFQDTNNCERIFAEIVGASSRTETLLERHSEVVSSAERVAQNQKFYLPVMKKVFKLLRMLPVRDDIIVFESSRGKEMSDSPRAIYDELVRRGDTRTKVWFHNGSTNVSDEYTRLVPRFSLAYFWYLARSKYWISNQHLPPYFNRRNKGVFLQTWHGTPLKKMMYDHELAATRDETFLPRYSHAVAQWSHLVSPSSFATEAFGSAFRHQAEVLEVGYPRNDILNAPGADDIAAWTRGALGIPTGKKVVLYAPTFRDDKPAGGNRFYFDPPFSIEEMAEALSDDHVLLIRLHGLIKDTLDIPDELSDRVIDVTQYPSLNELFLASDALITDYSSLFFDYATLRRPIVLFPYDLEKYRDHVRGFYLDFDRDLPFPVVTQLHELRAALEGAETERAWDKDFLARFAPHEDGNAARRVVDRLFGTS